MMEKLWKYKLDHIFFWFTTIGFHMYTRLFLLTKAGVNQFLGEIIIRNSLLAIVIYVNLLLLIPFLLKRRKILLYALSLIGTLLLYALLKNVHDVYLYENIGTSKTPVGFLTNTFYNFSIALFYLAFSVGLELSKAWFFQQEQIRKIELEKVNTELAYLKSQINPHFLFNSLNTVYFQIDKSNAEARDTLSKFSEMLRFQLYECNGKEIGLEKEINYLKNYVDLQRVRKDENYKIEFHSTGDLKDATIAPLLLIPFIENAFKHVSHHLDKKNEIDIRFHRQEDQFIANIINTNENRKSNPDSGIGLKNAKRRLELQYHERYELSITDTEGKFEVQLKLKLS